MQSLTTQEENPHPHTCTTCQYMVLLLLNMPLVDLLVHGFATLHGKVLVGFVTREHGLRVMMP